MRGRFFLAVLCTSAVAFSAWAAARAQTDPASLPAHDTHEGVLVAANPYLSANEYKDKFGKHTPYDAGILALEIYIRNENDKPIRINPDTISLRFSAPGESPQKIGPLSPEEVTNRVLLRKGKDTKAPRLPVPLPGGIPKTGRGKDWDELYGVLRSASLSTDVLPPNATVHGFLYFDIDHHYERLSTARFELPDLAFMLDNKALFFFEVDLAPAVR